MRQGRIGIVAAVLVCSGALLSSSGYGADETAAARVAQVWSAREQRVKSCRVTWSETRTYPKGTFFIDPQAPPDRLPPGDLTIKATCTLIIAGRKCRYEYQGEMWSTESRKVAPAADVTTFDGERSADTSLQSPLIEHPQVIIKKSSDPPGGRKSELLPIWLTVRPSVVAKILPIEEYLPTGRRETVNTRLCDEFTQTSSGKTREQVLLDPERGSQVVRCVTFANDKLWMKLDISYKTDPTLQWIPAAWELVVCNPTGGIGLSKRCVVTEFATNIDVADSDFQPVLPTGARVVDLTSGKEMHSGVLPTGERGKEIEFVPGKGMVPYETLMAQPPQSGLWSRVWPWALGGGGVVVVGIAVWLARRKRGATSVSG